MSEIKAPNVFRLLPAVALALALVACGSREPAETPPAATTEDITVVAADAEAEAQAKTDADAAVQALRQEELGRREAELTFQEREAELARREADLAAREQALQKPTAKPEPAKTTPLPMPATARTYVVPSGTQLSVEIVSPVTTKTAVVGDRVDARLASDVVVDGKTLVPAGAAVHGTVTRVISGSKTIGGTPTLGLTFDRLSTGGADMVAISGQLVQQGASDKGRDAAKIAGGALIGAVVGHQVDEDKGKIIGGLLGAAGGALVAQKTGTEVEVPAGAVVGFVLDQPFEVIAK